MFGFQNIESGEWLDNDFQSPHVADIDALIAACYASREAFIEQHGDPEMWVKREISMEEIQAIFSGGGA